MKKGGFFIAVLLLAAGLMAMFPLTATDIDPFSLSGMTLSSASAQPGDTLTVTLTLDNQGPDAYTGAALTNPLPAGLSFVPASQTATSGTASLEGGALTWSGDLAVGAPVTITYQALVETAAKGRSLVNTAQLTAGSLTKTLSATLIVPPLNLFLPLCGNKFRGCGDFLDDFSDPASGWFAGSDTEVLLGYQDGEYRILGNALGYIFLSGAPTCAHENYTLDVDAHWVNSSGDGMGLLFGIVGDYEEYYFFAINTEYKDYSLVYRFGPNEALVIQDWTKSSAIHDNSSANHLSVRRSGSQTTLSVNGTTLGTWNLSEVTGPTYSGLFAFPYDNVAAFDARFDNYKMTVLQSGQSSAFSASSALAAQNLSQILPAGGLRRAPIE